MTGMAELLIGRQPIFDRKLDVIAYELLYRSVGQPDRAEVLDGDHATTQVTLNAFSEIGLDNIVGDKMASINITRNFLLGKYPIPFPPQRVILEVLEGMVVDQPLKKALDSLVQAGYWFALDDVVSVRDAAPLWQMAKIIKVDLRNVNRRNLTGLVSDLKSYHVPLLAEKVETQEEFNLCNRLGFDFFQGYFLCKPSLVRSRRVDSSRLVVLQSLAKLQDPKNFEALEEVISQDASLVYKMLKLVNSGYYSFRTKVDSIGQAIAKIGFDQIKGWMTLLLMAAVANKPHELTVIALQRARMCEMFARAKNYPHPETYFLTGLLSVLDALLDITMDEVVNSLPLTPELTDALLTHKGRMGGILNVVIAYEKCDWDEAVQVNLGSATIQKIYLDSIYWAKKFSDEIKNAPC
jgi:c-di-GMP phosphodiesterase